MNYLSKTLTLFYLFALFFQPIFAQTALNSFGSVRGLGSGNANLTYRDISSSFHNQAGLAYLENFSALISVENRFLIKELQYAAFSIAKPTPSGTWGIIFQRFGFEKFREQKLGLNYSRKLAEKLAIGAQFDFLNTQLKDYGNATALTFEVGLHYQILEKLRIGTHIYNPIRANIGTEALPSILQIGLTYQPTNQVLLSAAVEANTLQNATIRVGLEYNLVERIQLRLGINSQPHRIHFGVGYLLESFQINMAVSHHTTLGFTPAIGIQYFEKR